MKVRYRDLTPEMLRLAKEKGIINGCGGKGSWVPVPDWLFRASCFHHDFNYWVGGDENDRRKADKQFYVEMLTDAEDTPWWYPTRLAKVRAWVYYMAVRVFAKKFFHYGKQRTLADFLEAIA